MFEDDEEIEFRPLTDGELEEAIKKNPLLGTTLRLYNEKAKEELMKIFEPSPFLTLFMKNKAKNEDNGPSR